VMASMVSSAFSSKPRTRKSAGLLARSWDVTLYSTMSLVPLGPPVRLLASEPQPSDGSGTTGRGARRVGQWRSLAIPGRNQNLSILSSGSYRITRGRQRPVNIGDDSIPMPLNPRRTEPRQSRKPNKIGVPYGFLLRARFPSAHYSFFTSRSSRFF